MSATTTVTVGGREYTLAPFGARRAFAAMRMIAAINNKVGDLQTKMGAFARDYAKANALRITREHAWMPSLPRVIREMTAEDWERVGGSVELPQSPTNLQIYGAVLPEVIGAAEEDVLGLLALAVVSNDDYGNAVLSGGVERLLNTKRDELLAGATVEELVVLVDAVVGHTGGQLRPLMEKVPNLRRLLPGSEEEPEAEDVPSPSETPETSETNGTRPDSSTPSAEPSDGTPEPSSTESPTRASSGSPD